VGKQKIPAFKKALDVGCGEHCLPGAVGIDHLPFKGVLHVHNLNQSPWPLADNQFDFIRCQHVIEHMEDLFAVAREMYRVSEHGAKVDFITPHYSSYASWGDPTHRWHFALSTIPHLFRLAIGEGKYKVVNNELKFTGAVIEFPGWLIYKINAVKYEKHFAWIWPANEIHTTIEFIKN
jgi:SAM-dependent methyltransferase